ncbi:MAG: alpha/beta hydrolase [Bacteroidota bacterium]|nr:alpha/beta hydrolase [Bacteroidota bacterium]MDX5404435.1 alpha/beta hydrolase [Bacteroidota bacterium]MDX5448862.1 alpha/beta hydrolase [Bacteroidota bacterium]
MGSLHKIKLLFSAFTLAVLILSNLELQGQSKNPLSAPTPISIGEKRTLYSKNLGEERTINVYLPPEYFEDTTSQFPVIYLLDGGLEEDFLHVLGLVQFESFPWVHQLPPTIVVGIENIDRIKDMTSETKDPDLIKEFPTSGGSYSFFRFLVTELKPSIETEYRTKATSCLIGQSMAGLFAAEVLVRWPMVFDQYIIVSPSLWWDNELLLKRTPHIPTERPQVFIAVGKEGYRMEELSARFRERITEQWGSDEGILFQFYPDRTHGDILHEALMDAFQWLYPDLKKD